MSIVGDGLGQGNTGYEPERTLAFGSVVAGGLGLRLPTIIIARRIIDLVVCVTRQVELTVER